MTADPKTGAAQVPAADTAFRAVRPRKKWRILVVDDNRDIVNVIRRVLLGHGYEVLEAFDGAQALELARRERPDLILLDWMLPEKSGLEVCRELKGDPETRGIMILLVTGRGSIYCRLEGLDAGADDYIPKPFNHPELLARIRSALRIKELTDDLAERNRQLIASQQELVRSEKMATIGLLASGIAHEFNNIMAGISGYAQLARRNPKYLPQLVEVALTQAERALEITRSLSTLHRKHSGGTSCRVRRVISNALCLVKKELETHGIEIEICSSEAPPAAMSPGQFQEVVLNMLINAIHAIEATGRPGVIRMEVRHEKENDFVVFRISDTGEGIPEENLQRIFDPFFTTKGALGGGKRAGTGLGLSVCYNLVRSHGGDIQVTSELGKGTTFTVRLPVYRGPEAEDDAAGNDRARAGRRPLLERSLKILVVDDENTIRTMLEEYLEGHEVECVANGEEALARYRDERYDYVLLDICMQNSRNGIEVLRELKRLDPQARVILSSGKLPEEIAREDLELAHGHLLKPFKFEALAALLGLGQTPEVLRA